MKSLTAASKEWSSSVSVLLSRMLRKPMLRKSREKSTLFLKDAGSLSASRLRVTIHTRPKSGKLFSPTALSILTSLPWSRKLRWRKKFSSNTTIYSKRDGDLLFRPARTLSSGPAVATTLIKRRRASRWLTTARTPALLLTSLDLTTMCWSPSSAL